MSTTWRIRCAEHGDVAEEGVNRGQGFLRSLIALREPLAALVAADPGGEVVEVETWLHPNSAGLYFVVRHPTCPLELVSEDGDVEPADSRCEAVTDRYVHGFQCERQAGHSGKHEATLERYPRARLEWSP